VRTYCGSIKGINKKLRMFWKQKTRIPQLRNLSVFETLLKRGICTKELNRIYDGNGKLWVLNTSK